MKKLKIQMNGRSDEFGTPKGAIDILLPYLKKDWTIWECAWGKGSLAKHLESEGFKVVGSKEIDFLNYNVYGIKADCIITNPPYSKKEEFLEKCYSFAKPFALLMPLTALEGKKRGALYKKYGIQLIIPNKRFNFETPSGKGSGSWFATAWFCFGLNLPKDLNFCIVDDIENKKPHADVFIERAGNITKHGSEAIRAICGTDEEYSAYVKKYSKENIDVVEGRGVTE